MSLCSPVTCPCPQREDFLNFCINESLLKQGEVSREVVFLLCRTQCPPENEPPGLSPPPPNPPLPAPRSALGRCLWAREVSWGTGLWGLQPNGPWVSQGGSLGRQDFAFGVVGPCRATVGAGTELQENFRNRLPRDMSGYPEMRTRRPLVKMIWSMKFNPYQI